MKRKTLAAFAVLVMTALLMLTGCSEGGRPDRNTVYEDMKSAFEQSGLKSANIGIFTKTEDNGNIQYGNGGSGVIIMKDADRYYALTSAHVVASDGGQILVYTVNTEMKTEEIPGMDDLTILSRETYDSMYTAELFGSADRDDIAVISFTSDEDLSVAEIAGSDPAKGDRIMCVGNPDNEWFADTYGTVTSGIKKFGESTDYPSNVMEHTAYMNSGSSGGAAFDEQMKVAGITPGVLLSLDGKTVKRGVLIPASEIRLCLEQIGGIDLAG